ncbi:hypothetical protein K470DRAFT_278243 [Piedraia hortae CBS 480.64]|uniref:Uncharacterized protein n=1 Tax=Piedraia hortae CBS 480.64 TaxID=1314780 RepID=A0A6A7BU38_9PEZI|nr:hypothetical protein K470DRAFT_278243 [Piedraia hortae CBS 480.64]
MPNATKRPKPDIWYAMDVNAFSENQIRRLDSYENTIHYYDTHLYETLLRGDITEEPDRDSIVRPHSKIFSITRAILGNFYLQHGKRILALVVELPNIPPVEDAKELPLVPPPSRTASRKWRAAGPLTTQSIMDDEVVVLTEKRDEWKKKAAELAIDLTKLQGREALSNQEKESLKAMIKDLEEQIEEHKERTKVLDEQVKEMRSETKVMSLEGKKKQEQIIHLHEKLEELYKGQRIS